MGCWRAELRAVSTDGYDPGEPSKRPALLAVAGKARAIATVRLMVMKPSGGQSYKSGLPPEGWSTRAWEFVA